MIKGYEWVPDAAEKAMKTVADLEVGEIELVAMNLIHLSNLYLYASHAYYDDDHPIMSDGLYDKICVFMHENFDLMDMVGVWFSLGITKDNLAAGTCLGVDHATVTVLMSSAMQGIARKELELLVA